MRKKHEPTKLIIALENNDYNQALSLINSRVERVSFFLQNNGKSLLDTGFCNTPLAIAARDGNMQILLALLKAGANVDGRGDAFGHETPLHAALQHKKYEAAKHLISVGADVNAMHKCTMGGYPSSPLHIAVREDLDLSIIKLLVENGANLVNYNYGYDDVLCDAARCIADDNFAKIEFLLKQKNINNQYANIDPNRLGFSKGYRSNHISSSPLYFALEHNKEKIAMTLINYGADIYLKWNGTRGLPNGFHNCVLNQAMIDTAVELAAKNGITVSTEYSSVVPIKKKPIIYNFTGFKEQKKYKGYTEQPAEISSNTRPKL